MKKSDYSNFLSAMERGEEELRPEYGDLQKTRNLISYLLSKLEQDLSSPDDFDLEKNKFLWGEKENAVSLLTKLTQMMIKIMPDEKEKKIAAKEQISEEDMVILKEYVERYFENKAGAKSAELCNPE